MNEKPIQESKIGGFQRFALIQKVLTPLPVLFTMSLIGCATLKWFPGEAPTTFYSGSFFSSQPGSLKAKLKKPIRKNSGATVSAKLSEPNCITSESTPIPKIIGSLSFFYLSKHQADIKLSYSGYAGLDCHEIIGFVPDSIMVDSIEVVQEPNKRKRLDLWIYAGGGK